MDSRNYVIPAVVISSLALLIWVSFFGRDYPSTVQAVSEPYMKKFDCYMHPPDVICSVSVCNLGSAAMRDVRLTIHVFDDFNRHYTAFTQVSAINPYSIYNHDCSELVAELHNEGIGDDLKLKGVLSYASGDDVEAGGITLFNIW